MEYKNRAWIYCRIDAPEDTHGALKNQRMQLMDYADQMGFETVGCSGDTASGLEFDRLGLKRFLDAAGKGKVDFLIVHDLSRIGGGTCEAVEFLNRIEQMGVLVYSPLEGRLEFTMQDILRETVIKQRFEKEGDKHDATEKRN